MSRPIPVEIIPSHVHLSAEHLRALFGDHQSGTVDQELSQAGQFVYQETVTIVGTNGTSIVLRVLGPSRKSSQVELTPTEAQLLGLPAQESISGDLSRAVDCTLKTDLAAVSVPASVIVPYMHLHLSDSEAAALRLSQGDVVRVDIVGSPGRIFEHVQVRVHPTYRARLHVHADIAREFWLASGTHVRVRDIQD